MSERVSPGFSKTVYNFDYIKAKDIILARHCQLGARLHCFKLRTFIPSLCVRLAILLVFIFVKMSRELKLKFASSRAFN